LFIAGSVGYELNRNRCSRRVQVNVDVLSAARMVGFGS
jgi:hypothetical protein